MGLNRCHQRASYTVPASILCDTEITQPHALFTRVRFKSTAEQSKANDAISVLGNEAFEPSVRTEAAIQQWGDIGTGIRIIDLCGEVSGKFRNRSHVLR
jgi:hypothetical protein